MAERGRPGGASTGLRLGQFVASAIRRIRDTRRDDDEALRTTLPPPPPPAPLTPQAAELGDEAIVSAWLARPDADPDARTAFGSTLLHRAARAGRPEVVALLLAPPPRAPVAALPAGPAGPGGRHPAAPPRRPAAVGAVDFGGLRRTALHHAARGGHVRCVELLLRAGADPVGRGRGFGALVLGTPCGAPLGLGGGGARGGPAAAGPGDDRRGAERPEPPAAAPATPTDDDAAVAPDAPAPAPPPEPCPESPADLARLLPSPPPGAPPPRPGSPAARAAAARAERGQAVLLSLEAAAGAATWRPGDAALHRRFPRRFRAAARAVLLAALATAGRTARGAPDDAPVAFGDLPLDVVLHEILPRLAFPLSAWIGEEE